MRSFVEKRVIWISPGALLVLRDELMQIASRLILLIRGSMLAAYKDGEEQA
jgi:hypothetical protein